MHSGISNMVRTTQEHNQPSNELFIILYIYIYYMCAYIIRTLARVYYVISILAIPMHTLESIYDMHNIILYQVLSSMHNNKY